MKREDRPIFVVFTALVVLLALNFVFAAVPPPFCLSDETATQCWRDWIGATSGWAAAIAALFTAIILIRQLGILKHQLSEQKQQTAFITGNLGVELAWEQNTIDQAYDTYSYIMVYIINIGRRPVRICEIEIHDERNEILAALYLADQNSEDGEKFIQPVSHELPCGRKWRKELLISGWYNRNESPPRISLKLNLMRDVADNVNIIGNEKFKLCVKYRTLGGAFDEHVAFSVVDMSKVIYRHPDWKN